MRLECHAGALPWSICGELTVRIFHLAILALAAAPFVSLGCGIGDGAQGHVDDEPTTASNASELTASDPVSAAVAQSCETASVKGLSTQLVAEIQCIRPGTLETLEGSSGITLGSSVFPFAQAPMASALRAAQKARGTTLVINSALRTLPQQYLLYSWYKAGRCGIPLAAAPGKSNHESALAVDIEDNAGWRSAMTSSGFKWFGSSDPVHFDFVAGGGVELRGLSVLAFQRLWNRNHADDPIPEDSTYGTGTALRLAQAPVGGFAKGAACNVEVDAGGGADGSTRPTESDGSAGTMPEASSPGEGGGCTLAVRPCDGVRWPFALLAVVVFVAASRRRAR
jgi:hypothetical protein